jgi:FkbH-like protein
LNIGLNSLVFVDDNPAERDLIRQLLPEVAVPELPEDPAGYVQAVERHRYFQVTSVGAEDFRRAEYYRANAERARTESAAGDLDAFLKSLAMVAIVRPIDATSLERSVQLINKSNQFNLTTRRRTTAEVLALLGDDRWLTRTVTLADRFGDNGLISVLLARIDGEDLVIDTWLMSCRVLKRGVEALLHNHVCRAARERGLKRVLGEFIATPKNDLVRDHYRGLGYRRRPGGEDGHSWWEMPLDGWEPLPAYIEVR